MSVASSESEGTNPMGGVPPINFEVLQRARQIAADPFGADVSEYDLRTLLSDVLEQYDNLAGRLAILSVGGLDD